MNKTWVYHQILSPKGKIVTSDEADVLYKQGWVDTPAKYGAGLRGKWYSFTITLHKLRRAVFSLLQKEWKWFVGTLLTVAGLYIAYLKL